MSIALAVLIDAENIPASSFGALEEHIGKLGRPIIWQLFGDFLSRPLPGWKDIAGQKGLDICHQFQGGKNAADIAMTVAAMDLLHAGKVQGFCLASSDRDFTALARRLRAENLPVHGFGEAKTAKSFRSACSSFEVLKAGVAKTTVKTASKPLPPSAAARERGISKSDVERLLELLREVCRDKGKDGQVPLATAAAYLRAQVPELAARLGGTGKFLKSLKAMDLIDVHEVGAQRPISVR